jgi:hypothetical protein
LFRSWTDPDPVMSRSRSYPALVLILFSSYPDPFSVLYRSYLAPILILFRSYPILLLFRSSLGIPTLSRFYPEPIQILPRFYSDYITPGTTFIHLHSQLYFYSWVPPRIDPVYRLQDEWLCSTSFPWPRDFHSSMCMLHMCVGMSVSMFSQVGISPGSKYFHLWQHPM